MPNAVVQFAKRQMASAELKVRSALRALEVRRLRRLYGNLAPTQQPSLKDTAGQTKVLAGIVSAHCAAGTAAIETHRAAEMHLDAADYALSMIIEELRDVMAAPEISWKPARRPAAPRFIRVEEVIAEAA